ncbi:MAG: helix-turn-helix transcriptional regulator [Acidimicrobiales bacterium]|nr:helix-turn-helix transcriptional regulator [Acidimicrobiales bacterium]
MTVIRTARERARAEVRREILDAARRQLTAEGAEALSLRAVARELGMVSSALYRYFASRDELLTALIIEAYDELGERAERAAAATADQPAGLRWVAVARAVRAWAVDHPRRYALLYGTPVVGYAAPQSTVVPGTRVQIALAGIVLTAHRSGAIDAGRLGAGEPPVGSAVAADLARLRAALAQAAPDLLTAAGPSDVLLRATLLGWTQLFGLIGFELFGQLRGLVEDGEAFLVESAATMAARAGLQTGPLPPGR